MRALFVGDASAGILLILVAIAAMLAANSAWHEEYHTLFHAYLFDRDVFKLNTLHLWINDGLMAIFFFVVGLEVKRELIAGQLATAEQRRLPVLAAGAGMVAPALVYMFFVNGADPMLSAAGQSSRRPTSRSQWACWACCSRVPSSLRLFLLTVAIVDDIGAVLIIAMFYTASIKLTWLIGSIVVVGIMVGMNCRGVTSLPAYILMALVLWFFVLNSGVHATIVCRRRIHRSDDEQKWQFAARTARTRPRALERLSDRADLRLRQCRGRPVRHGAGGCARPLPIAIAAGLFLGKQIGIFSAIYTPTGFAPARKTRTGRKSGAYRSSAASGSPCRCSSASSLSRECGIHRRGEDRHSAGLLASAVIGYGILRMTTEHPGDTQGLANRTDRRMTGRTVIAALTHSHRALADQKLKASVPTTASSVKPSTDGLSTPT